MMRQIFEALTFWLGWVTGRKYESLARRFGQPEGAPPGLDRKRFIIIQIDGLAHEFLLQALAGSHLPTLQKLIAGGYRLQRWRCGAPSTTPAIQAGIMYGDNWDIPAFRWYEKESGFAPQCKSPAAVERVKARVAAGGQGSWPAAPATRICSMATPGWRSSRSRRWAGSDFLSICAAWAGR